MAKKQSAQKAVTETAQDKPVYPVDNLAFSRALSCTKLHPEIIRAVLGTGYYTIDDAMAKLQEYIDKFN